MKIGIIGVGIVGGALANWFETKTNHQIAKWDPFKKLTDDLRNSDAIFICIPVRPNESGQDQSDLEWCVKYAKSFSDKVFIRSTVLPGTNDRLGTISCPEFLTARIANEEMERLPILVGDCDIQFISEIFHEKVIKIVRNKEAELAKFAHNCFGAMKVTYFNMIYKLCEDLGLDYENVREAVLMSGFINKPHTQVPGPDGKFGYGGACFPENMEAMSKWFHEKGYSWFEDNPLDFGGIYDEIEKLNKEFRTETVA